MRWRVGTFQNFDQTGSCGGISVHSEQFNSQKCKSCDRGNVSELRNEVTMG